MTFVGVLPQRDVRLGIKHNIKMEEKYTYAMNLTVRIGFLIYASLVACRNLSQFTQNIGRLILTDLKHKIESLQGPILVLGASGFIGANAIRSIYNFRRDVAGTMSNRGSFRSQGVYSRVWAFNALHDGDIKFIVDKYKPATVFDFISYGAYPFQIDRSKIIETNIQSKISLLRRLDHCGMCQRYIHAGTSSEYGVNSKGPLETYTRMPNDDYSRSKYIWSEMMGLHMIDTPCANLRLYSVYGPYEDGSRLIPQVIQHGLRGEYPPFVRPNISRDFVYVDDVVEAFVDAALNLKPEDYGGSFNIGTGVKTTIGDIARIANETFDIGSIPSYTMPRRDWDHYNDWYANPTKARERLGWSYKTSLTEGVDKTIEWYKSQGEGWKWPTIKPASR